MNLDYSVNYRNVSSFNFKNNYFTSSDGVLPEVCEEQQVSPVKGRLHTATGRKHKVTVSGTECPKGSQSKLPAMVGSTFTKGAGAHKLSSRQRAGRRSVACTEHMQGSVLKWNLCSEYRGKGWRQN